MNRGRNARGRQRAGLLSLLLASLLLPAAMAQDAEVGNSGGRPTPRPTLNTLTEAERAWLREHPVIRVVQDPNWPPVEFADERGEPSGMTRDYLSLIEQRLGVKFEWVRNLSWQEAYARLKRGEIDMTTSVAATPERKEFWAFTKPYMRMPIVIATHPDVTFIAHMRELAGKNVAVVEGYAVTDWIPRDFPEIRLVRVQTAQEGLEALQRGQVFACVDNLLVIGYVQAKLKTTNIKIAGETPYVNAQSMAVRKDWAILAEMLDKALDSVSEAERNDIYRKWLPIRYEHGFNYTLLWQALALFGVVLMGLMVWIRKLSREISSRRQAEAASSESARRFRQLFEVAAMPLCFVSRQGAQMDFNDRFAQVFGYTRAEVPTLAEWWSLAYPDPDYRRWVIATWEAAVRRARENKTDIEPLEYRVTCKSGQVRTLVITGTFLGDDLLAAFFDVTERKQAEEALRRSEAFTKAVLDNLPVGIAVNSVDPSVTFSYMNDSFPKFYRTTRENLADPDAFWNVVYEEPEFREAMRRRVLEDCASGDVERMSWTDVPITRKGQATAFVTAKNIPLPDKRLMISIVWDNTERKQAEEALRLAHERLRRFVDSNVVGVVIADAAGEIIEANDYYLRLIGFTRDELEQRKIDWRAITPPEWLPADERAIRELRECGTGTPYEKEYLRRDGTRVPVLLADTMLPGPGEQIAAFALDISDRKRAEAALRASEEQFRAMFELASIGMAQADVQTGQWLRVNQKLCAITGYSAQEMLRARVSEITHPEDRQTDWDAFERVVNGEAPDYRIEKRYLRKDGTVAWVNVNMTVIRDTAGQPLRTMSAIEDITERKRLEEERAALEAQTRQQQKLESIGTLAGGVAHEINNPINGIMNYAQLIQDRLPADSPLTEFTGEILHETERVAVIVRNLLQFSRRENQTHSPGRITDIIESTLSLIRTVIRHDQITLTVDVSQDLPDLKCRSQQIQQVLMNLLTNARDALNERHPGYDADKVINLSARGFEKEGRRWIRVTVEDHGTGITPEVRDRMFDPFFTTKPRDQGTGLGLAISHGITKEHHGELTVETEPGCFTRIHVDLPVENGWDL